MMIHDNATGACDVMSFDEGGIDFAYCIQRCLDMDGCKGTTFDWYIERCSYHSCSNYTYWPAYDNATIYLSVHNNLQFMEKKCFG